MDVEQRYVISYYLKKKLNQLELSKNFKKYMDRSLTNVLTYIVGLESFEVGAKIYQMSHHLVDPLKIILMI